MTDRCPLCGGQPNAEVTARWELEIPVPSASQNGRDGRSGGANKGGHRFAYKRERQRYQLLVGAAARAAGVTRAVGIRRVRLTRLWSKRQRAYDHANLVGGAKPLVDAMVRLGLIVDDRPDVFEGYYNQEKDPTGQGRTRIVIEDLANGSRPVPRSRIDVPG